MKPSMANVGLISICVAGVTLFVIAATIALSLIPVYLKSDTSPYNGNLPFSMSYNLANGALPTGSIDQNHFTNLYNQLTNMTNTDSVRISVTSANIVNQPSTDRSVARRQATTSQILQLSGIVYAQKGCLRKCLVDFVRQFKTDLCNIQLSLVQ